jgi:hypothetical protein
MLRNPDKWIYAIERTTSIEDNQKTDFPFNLYGWKWSEGYDSVETIGKMYTRGEAVDMIFNRNYVFVRYLATQHLPWENGMVTFMKDTALKREVLTLEDIWDKLPDKTNNCDVCYGSCAQCVYRKVDTEEQDGQLIVKDIRCMYSTNELMQSLAKGNHYCKYFTCLHLLSKHNTTRC